MNNKNILGLFVAAIILIAVIVLFIFLPPPVKDMEVTVLDIEYETEEFFVNISLSNNQDQTGWISDTSLLTIEGNPISLTGAGMDKTVESGETIELTLYSAEIYDSVVDPPYKLQYTVFPSGRTYFVEI